MNTYETPTKSDRAVASSPAQTESTSAHSTFQFVDNRPASATQDRLREMANQRFSRQQTVQLQSMEFPLVSPGPSLSTQGVIQLSGFDSTDTYDGQIYGIYDNRGSGEIEASDCVYVGKTVTKNVGDRWLQHIDEDVSKPWYGQQEIDDGDYVVRQIWEIKDLTRFDIAVAEQYYIQLAKDEWGASLLNSINALTKAKFDDFKDTSVFTTKAYYGSWEPEG